MTDQTISTAGQAVLITGGSSGIGRAIAVHLAQQGFTVLATVRKQAAADALRELNEPNLVPLHPLDLTCREHIPPIVEAVAAELDRRGLPGLYALVNNAGGGSVAPIELMNLDEFATELNARLVGSVALAQACLPLIRRAQGRIVWIVTPALIPTPYVTSIHAADFAANCIARTLTIELKPWHIPNILIRCGGIQTESVGRSNAELEESAKRWEAGGQPVYADALRRWQASMADFDSKRTPPEQVARVVHRALVARKPKSRYSIGYMSKAAAILEALPQTWADAILASRF